jgi:SSS family solute:Na+ symporter
MGLRAAVLLVPMTIALFLPGRMGRVWAVGARAAGLVGVLAAEAAGFPFDPLLAGIAASAVVAGLGLLFRR